MNSQTDNTSLLATIARDEEGFLLYPDDWTREIALAIASEVEQDISDEHWVIVNFIREFFEQTQKVPEARSMLKHMESKWGEEKSTRRYLYTLFPRGYGQSACKIAGMRLPKKLMLDV